MKTSDHSWPNSLPRLSPTERDLVNNFLLCGAGVLRRDIWDSPPYIARDLIAIKWGGILTCWVSSLTGIWVRNLTNKTHFHLSFLELHSSRLFWIDINLRISQLNHCCHCQRNFKIWRFLLPKRRRPVSWCKVCPRSNEFWRLGHVVGSNIMKHYID